MVVQADAAAYLGGSDVVAMSLTSIGESGRQALADLRGMLGALRDSGDGNVARTPAVGGVADLVASVRAAGQPVRLVELGRRGSVSDAANAALRCVVQEGLTNAVKHAAGAATTVLVRHGDGQVEVEIQNGPSTRPGLGRGAGRGLLGLRERVVPLGGELASGSGRDGGFVLRARIPTEGP